MVHSPFHILVVDDLSDWQITLSRLLSSEGYIVETAGSTEQALHLIDEKSFDLAILDIRLDEEDEGNKEGLVLGTKIKKQKPDMPIIFLTGYANQEYLQIAMQPGTAGALAANFIEKLNDEEFLKAVHEALVAQTSSK